MAKKAYGLEEEDFEIKEDIYPINPNFKEFKEQEEETAPLGQQQLEDLFKFLAENELTAQAQKMISPLISLLESSESYEEAYELLTDKNLKSKKFEESLQKALFLSELQGRSDGLND